MRSYVSPKYGDEQVASPVGHLECSLRLRLRLGLEEVKVRVRVGAGGVGAVITILDKKACQGLVW